MSSIRDSADAVEKIVFSFNIVLVAYIWFQLKHTILNQSKIKLYISSVQETMLLEPTNNRFMEVYGNKQVLLIRNFSVQGKLISCSTEGSS